LAAILTRQAQKKLEVDLDGLNPTVELSRRTARVGRQIYLAA